MTGMRALAWPSRASVQVQLTLAWWFAVVALVAFVAIVEWLPGGAHRRDPVDDPGFASL